MSSFNCTTIVCSWLVMVMAKGMEHTMETPITEERSTVQELRGSSSRTIVKKFSQNYSNLIEHLVHSFHARRDYQGLVNLFNQQSLEEQINISKLLYSSGHLKECIHQAHDTMHTEFLEELIILFNPLRFIKSELKSIDGNYSPIILVINWAIHEKLKNNINIIKKTQRNRK